MSAERFAVGTGWVDALPLWPGLLDLRKAEWVSVQPGPSDAGIIDSHEAIYVRKARFRDLSEELPREPFGATTLARGTVAGGQ